MQGVAKVLVAHHDVYKGFLPGENDLHTFDTDSMVLFLAVKTILENINKIVLNCDKCIFFSRGVDSIDFGNSETV